MHNLQPILRQLHVKSQPSPTQARGFTLLEILIALFIFTILSLLLTSALHQVINVQSGTEKSAARLAQLQVALLVISRDIEQASDRPVISVAGDHQVAFIGGPQSFTLTHGGVADALSRSAARSGLQRVRYFLSDDTLQRETWPVLDAVRTTRPLLRGLFSPVKQLNFTYLADDGFFYKDWPPAQQQDSQQQRVALPKAIRISLSIPSWGKLTQLYLLPSEHENIQPPKTH